jgi:formylglycine-generating enzyme required for sulfatase activity
MSLPLRLRVFLSSPGDVADERALARKVLDYLPKERFFSDRVLIQEVSWDDPGSPVPLVAHLTPQDGIDRIRPRPSECDIVVVILWSRMGTPLPDDRRKPDGSRYVSGTEWEFLDAMEAAGRCGRPMVLVYRRREEPRIGLKDPDFEEKTRQFRLVEAFFEGFQSADRSLRWSHDGYETPSEFADKLERQLRDLIASRLEKEAVRDPPAASADSPAASSGRSAASEKRWSGNPYRGLDAFRMEDAPIFFGRGRETDALIRRVGSEARVVAVIGPSGSGKSSLVAAGLFPRLAGGALPGSADWVTVRFTPAEAGDDPFKALGLRLFPLSGGTAEALAERLRSEPAAIEALADRVLAGRPAGAQLLLFADQFEELFTPRVSETHRAPFVALIDAIAGSRRVRMVLTLRADYYEHCTRFERLAERLGDGSFPLAIPTARALTEMVERPARAAGLEPEPGLVDAILADTGAEPGALALVEFTLARLYEARADGRLSLDAYRALGGVGGAIEVQANKTLDDAGGQADPVLLGRIFRALAEVTESAGAVRKRARPDAFGAAEGALIERLVKARLVVTDRDGEGVAWVEVAHEAVLRHWPRFRDWLDQNRKFLLWHKDFKVRCKPGAGLLQGEELAEAKGWFDRQGQALSDAERHFIEDSLEAVARSEEAARRRARGRWLAAGTALVVLIGTSLWLWRALEAEWEKGRPIVREEDWVPIAPGEFQMGSPDTDDEASPDEKPQHLVRITEPFLLSRYEVTFEEYDRYAYATGARPAADSGFCAGLSLEACRRLPVINISYDDAVAYAKWLSEETGKTFRLPTEAEWEYAARAGTAFRRFWGDEPSGACEYANVFDKRNEAAIRARYTGITWAVHECEDPYPYLAPVGALMANPWGLHDLLGNVFEWVQDCWHDHYGAVPPNTGAPADGSAWQAEDGDCGRRVIRGGSWGAVPSFLRSAYRYWFPPVYRYSLLGFRLAQDP